MVLSDIAQLGIISAVVRMEIPKAHILESTETVHNVFQ